MTNTSGLIAEHRRTGVHPCDEHGVRRVSSTNSWDEDLWLLDAPSRNHSRSGVAIEWTSLPLPLVPLFKELYWSVFISRPDGQPYSLSYGRTLFNRLRYLAKWMHGRKRKSFGSITPPFIDAYIKDLKAYLRAKAKEREAEFTTGTVVGYLKVLEMAFEQRTALERVGHDGISFHPFGEGSAWAEADEIAPYVDSFTPPIPDELVIPIVAQAYRFVREAADDVVELQSRIVALSGKQLGGKRPRTISRKQFRNLRTQLIRDYARAHAEDRPWLANFLPSSTEQVNKELPSWALRRLAVDVVAAAVIVIRFSTGIRHGEILSFEPGLGPDGLPLCVEREISISGAYELFFVKGVVSKGWDHPEDARWLLASRVNGDGIIPDAVRALQVIERILAPWRARSTDPDVKTQLLLQFGFQVDPTETGEILPMLSTYLATMMKDFYERRVDQSGIDFSDPKLHDFAGEGIRKIQSKQWRKTWANFVFRTNRKLLPAISQQFQHFSTVLTQEAYIGKDAEQLGLIGDAATERAIEFMYDALEGKPGVGGMARKAIDKLADLKAKVRGIGTEEQRGAIRAWLVERDIAMWPAPHGMCFLGMMPTGSRCHAAGETLDWSNQAPNFMTRNPRLCSGCACFAVGGEDIPFWAQRYLENKRIWDEAVELHMDIHYAVARERYVASEHILRSLDVDIEQLERDFANAH